MWLRWWVLVLLAASAAGKGKKHRHQKPGRALLDRLTSTNEGEVIVLHDVGLLPAPLDAAPYATHTANATCGDNGAEEFCRDTPGKRGVVCDVCEGLDGPVSRRHPPSHAVDGDPSTWWQSPTQASGEEYTHVEFVSTLPAKMELLHVIMKSGPSPRPLAWSLEVSASESGDDWRMVRAFGDREHCRRLWDLRPERRRRKARGTRKGRADKPTCSTQFASPKPLENGEMHVGLGEGVVARRVRVSFRGAHPAPARRRYYTLRALTLAARCICHGHARHCTVDDKGAKCNCLHDTCGSQCSRCCSGGHWKPHEPCAESDGKECSCGERGACTYDDTGAIVCVNCTENRAGPLCDRCLPGFYSVHPDGTCQPCECDPEGSNGTCHWNKKHHQFTCACRDGFSGRLCDACADPRAAFPTCVPHTEPPCKCDPRGIVDPTRICDEVCECKKNVMGDRCDTCALGHFGLSADLVDGCRPCYCSHITDSCSAAPHPEPPKPDIVLPLGDAWLVSDAEGNQTLESSVDEQGKPYIVSYEVEGWDYFYWYSSSWQGEQLEAYGDMLQGNVFWSVVRGDTEGNPTMAPDFILVAADGTKLASTNTSHESAGSIQLSAPLMEGSWFVLGEEYTSLATRTQLMDALRNLQGLMLRAHFHFDQDEVRLESVRIQRRSLPGIREHCACPLSYAGAHCSHCAWGAANIARSPLATPQFECVPCACNGHAGCETVDGPCGPCQHNTTGPHCERCLPGHYGNPVQGACKPCACPLYLASNNFSPNCALASAEGDDFVCTQCPDGYAGDHCEHCDFGYWGSPTTAGSSCQQCDCGGAPCDTNTGLCLTCPDNTEGARCDQCKEGYWFGPEGWRGAGSACVACGCGIGALAIACDARTGQCACREGWGGRTCDVCAEGHGGVEEGCPACRCGIAARDNACDAASGACACAGGAAPPRCEDCLPDHYGVNATGCLEARRGRRNQPVASRTALGWVLHGTTTRALGHRVNFVSHTEGAADLGTGGRDDDNRQLNELLKQHFALESLVILPKEPRNDPQQQALQVLQQNTVQLQDGRYQTGLLWKSNDVSMPNNYDNAYRRLMSTERKIDKDPELKKKYEQQMESLITKGYAERAPPEASKRVWYLPHFPVLNPMKPGKVRVVHDAAAKTRGMSLNDCLMTGPDLLQSLPGVLMRFRQHPIAVTGDIAEMFMQVKIRPEDRDALRYLWRGQQRGDHKPEEYRMTSLIFGATSSPATAIYVKNINAKKYEDSNPEAYTAIVRNHYVDDYLQSFSSEEQAIKIASDVRDIHREAHYELRQWTSNSQGVLQALGEVTDNKALQAPVGLQDGAQTERVLGLIWRPAEDVLTFNLDMARLPQNIVNNDRPTKREMLKIIMSLFDPLGFAAPVTSRAKQILQETWRRGTGWDDKLDDDTAKQWQSWMSHLQSLKKVSIPRCLQGFTNACRRELHTFVDASEVAYAAVLYWRMTDNSGQVTLSLVLGKSRVCPLTVTSIPRLELQAAVMGVRMAATVIEEHDIKPDARYFWTDSKTVLAWIRNGSRTYRPFVAHRIAAIEEVSTVSEWRWLPTKLNVADDATRDVPSDLNSEHRWFVGPDFLREEPSSWPADVPTVIEKTGEERTCTITSCNCSRLGAEGNACDIRTGQCRCRPHVVGRACDTCEVGYWGLQLGGCRRCDCGLGAAACDPVTGACACAPGVGGAQCDRCLPGYYGFRPAGCLPCPTCSDGKICSLDTGQCVCPPRSRGPGCRQCAPGYWSRENGCQPCTCGAGAISNTCDPVTGQCKCRTGWGGSRCERCAPGHFGPRCRPCDCSPAGTKDCEDGACDCDDDGRCLCKENVVGEKCEQCLDGTFGLSAENPSGCTACFCFGRAAHCTQATLTRAALHNTNPMHITLLKGDQITTVDIHSPLAVPMHNQDVTISLPWPPAPVYVELDNRFPGDRITSYGGLLRYTVEEEGGEELSLETRLQAPLVSMYSGDIVLDYYENIPAKNGSHAVRFHESLWWVRGRGIKASRAALMVVLQKLQRVLIRATSRAPTTKDHVHALLLNVSLDTAIPGLSRTAAALGVERCACREGYSSESCQKPARGYWLPQQRIRISSTDGTVIIAIDGEAQRCDCNGRAVACDPDTGACLNCTGGTGGERCEVCAPGYHGSPNVAPGCVACPCPSRARNFADACEFEQGRLRCLCKPGYTGMECEQCAEGWFRAGDGSCVPCACDERGAAARACDRAGRCRCRPFATGLKCDKCRAPRTYLDGGECKECDNCTQTLLDSIEGLTAHLQRNANPTELSRIPKPFPALREFSRNASELYTKLRNYRIDAENSRNLDSTVSRLEADEHRIFTDTNTFKTDALRRQDEARSLSLESMSGLEKVIEQRRKIGEQVEALDEFARGERHLSAHKALKEARKLLRHINDIKLIDYLGGANDVFDSAHLQSTSIQEYNYRLDDLYQRVRSLQTRLEDWERKTDEFPKLADVVWSVGDAVAAAARGVRPRLAAVRDTGLRCRLVLEDITTLSAHNLTDETYSDILLTQALAIKFSTLTSELATLMMAAEEKEGILYNLTPVYREKYLKSVERHVADLNEKAMQYKSLFADTRAASSLGVSAARAWSGVADALRGAAAAASAALATAAAAASLARGTKPTTVEPGIKTSDSLKMRGAEVLTRAEELQKQLDQLIRSADAVSVSLRGLGWAERELGATPRASVSATLAAAGRQADRVFVTTRALYDEASELRQKMRYQLRRQLADLQRHGDTALGAAQEHVSQISSNTVRGAELSQALAGAAAARARERAAAAERREPALRALKDAVAKAKHAAQTISVSLTSPPGSAPGCSRAYLLRSHSPSVTRLSLALSFDVEVRDGILLYLAGEEPLQDKQSYMRLFVHNKRLHLRWELGAGEGHIHHPEELLPTHDDADHTTYRVEIERIWNTVHLRLERAGSSVVSASNSSAARADTLRASRLWLGAPPDFGGGSWALPACVHALHTDDSVVGLWNFVEQPKEAQCTGCTQRWVGSRGGPAALAWMSAGYAELRRTSLRAPDRRHFSLALTFRTRDRDALLFMALDAANNRSISVWLRSCRVVFAVQYSGARLEITAGGQHCDGRPAHVQAIRVFAGNQLEKGSLRVNGEETLGSPSPPVQSAAALPDLTSSPYWVGGLPPGAGVEAPAPPLLGCLGAVSVDREGYDLMDTPTRHAVEPNCGTRVLRSAVFEGSGSVELPSPTLRRRGAVGLSFSARAPSGLLLYRAPAGPDDDDVDDKHHLALMMVDGELEVVASAGKEELKLRSNGTRFDDRRLHVVKLMRVHKQLEVWADGERILSAPLSGPAFPARSRGLYVGGLPNDFPGMKPTMSSGFTGTIADVIMDTQLLGYETAVEWSGAALGRADSEPQDEPYTEPRALQAQPDAAGCSKTPSYAVEGGAAKFGDAAGSHAALRLQPSARLSLSLQFRTMRPDGLLVLIPGSKTKPKHYTALMLREGKLRLVVRGRRRKEISLTEFVADGVWRTVSVRILRGRMSLSSGAAAARAHAAPAARAHRLYVGGLPHDYAALMPHLPNSIVRVGGFRGCVRRVVVGGRQEELVRDTRSHHALGQCFPNIERGAYFAGDAYATWSSNWSWGPEAVSGAETGAGADGDGGEALEVSLQFRTAKPSGVLVAARPLLLELRDGQVVLTRTSLINNQAGTEWVTGGRALCDNAWHSVSGRVSRGTLSLSLDGGPALRRADAGPLLDEPTQSQRGPLYVGGLPEGAIEGGEIARENFKGCLRDVTVAATKRDWTEMEATHNVLLDSCPVQQ